VKTGADNIVPEFETLLRTATVDGVVGQPTRQAIEQALP
jgi:hypothetical protein